MPERFLDHHPTPFLGMRVAQPRPLQLLEHHRECTRRNREIERVVAAGAADPVQVGQRRGQRVEGVVVVERTLDEPEPFRQMTPDLFGERGSRVLPDRIVDDLAEILVRPVPPGEPDQGEARRQQPPVRQVVDRRHQLLSGEIAGDPEDHDSGRTCDARQPLVAGIPKWVHYLGGHIYRRCPFTGDQCANPNGREKCRTPSLGRCCTAESPVIRLAAATSSWRVRC